MGFVVVVVVVVVVMVAVVVVTTHGRMLTRVAAPTAQSAIFNFEALLLVLLLIICTCAYIEEQFPQMLKREHSGFRGFLWKLGRIGVRKSEYCAVACVVMAVQTLFS